MLPPPEQPGRGNERRKLFDPVKTRLQTTQALQFGHLLADL